MKNKVLVLRHKGKKVQTADIVFVVIALMVAFITVYPMWYVICMSFSSAETMVKGAPILWPDGFHLNTYKIVFKDTALFRSYLMSVFYVVMALLLMLTTTVMMAYPLTRRDLAGRKFVTIFLLIPMYFSGGMIPGFILITKFLNLYNTVWAVILPGVGIWNIILCRTFMASIPHELTESAFIDGAGINQVLFKIILPLSKPVLAVISIYTIVGQWNSWWGNMLYQTNTKLHSVQMYLQRVLIQQKVDLEALINMGADEEMMRTALERAAAAAQLKYAMIVLTTVPILMVYPMFQKHFVKGVMLGSLKG